MVFVAKGLYANRHSEREYLSLLYSVMQGHRFLAITCGEVIYNSKGLQLHVSWRGGRNWSYH